MMATRASLDATDSNSRIGRPSTRREANVAARRQRILDSARALLAEDGPEGLSMRKLARQAGLSVTTLYNLIGSRETILQALIHDSTERLGGAAPKTRKTRDPLRRAPRALDSMLSYMIENGAVLRPLIVAEFSTGRFLQKLGQQDQGKNFLHFKRTVRDAIGEAIACGKLREAVGLDFLEEQLYASLELALDRWAFGFFDDETFRLRSLGGFYLGLLAFAEPELRPRLERELRRVERRLERHRTTK